MSFRASSEAEHTAGASVAGMGMVTAGSMFANVAAYLLQVLASRMLGVEGYGEFASLLAAQLVLAVPALALQSVPGSPVQIPSSQDPRPSVLQRASLAPVVGMSPEQ